MNGHEGRTGASNDLGGAGLAGVVAAQARVIEELRGRLDALEAGGRRTASERSPAPVPGDVGGDEVRTDRRHLLALAGVTAAGAVAGTAVLAAGASPASADTGNFEGNPGVFGTANPGGANGVVGSTVSGVGVLGDADATSGFAVGVQGVAGSPEASGVAGSNFATTGNARGVQGYSASSEGFGVHGWASSETGATTGVSGGCQSPSGVGVDGSSNSPIGNTVGVKGGVSSPTGRGVVGIALNPSGSPIGVQGDSGAQSGIGVQALAGGQTGIALQALGKTSVDAQSNRTHLRLGKGSGAWPTPPLDAGLARVAGELVFDGSRLWLCVASGTPGTWREVAGPATAGSLHVLDTSVRPYDSRVGAVPTNVVKGRLLQNQERTIDLRVGGGVPNGVRAAIVNLTVANTAGGGFLKAFKPGTPVPTASVINWFQGQTVANSATVAVTSNGGLTLRCGGNGASTDVIVDVAGYYL